MESKNNYIVSARKYRPATFKTVVGQRALTATLKNAIKSGKLAQAYLFCGPRGVGKTSCARIFAKTINCQAPTPDGEACGECESCRAIERGNSFNLVELDAASNNSVDDIRNITEQVNIPPQDGRYRVFIIDEVHMLSNAAFNAFLKTLEEPPKNVVFILATTERHKVIPTILSRCQVYDFRRITVNDIIEHLDYVAREEEVSADRESLGVIAQQADGAMRDALSIFDQVVASTQGNLKYEATIDALNVLDQDYYFKLIDLFREGDVAQSLLIYKEITDKGFDSQFFINGLAQHIRNLMVSADPRTLALLETSEELEKKYKSQSPSMPVEWYYSAMKILNDADYNYRTATNKRLLVELTLIRLSRLLKGDQVPFVKPDGVAPQSVPAKKEEAIKEKKIEEPVAELQRRVAAPQPKRIQPSKIQSFRITNEKNNSENNKREATRATPFTPEQFKEVWERYAQEHPEQRILVAAMRNGLPQKREGFEYMLEVDHPAQKQAFESEMTYILDYLKQALDNDLIKLDIEISKKNEEEKGMNPKELLQLTINENPELAKFLKAVEAELEI